MNLSHKRVGTGPPLLLIHGLGGSQDSFDTIVDALAERREVIAIDLPGSGGSAPLPGDHTIPAYADAVTSWLTEQGLLGTDVVGSSLGARLALELARRGGVVGRVVALDPGGFWSTERSASSACPSASRSSSSTPCARCCPSSRRTP